MCIRDRSFTGEKKSQRRSYRRPELATKHTPQMCIRDRYTGLDASRSSALPAIWPAALPVARSSAPSVPALSLIHICKPRRADEGLLLPKLMLGEGDLENAMRNQIGVSANRTGEMAVRASMPVSYTHLDVYKRQSSPCVAPTAMMGLMKANELPK